MTMIRTYRHADQSHSEVEGIILGSRNHNLVINGKKYRLVDIAPSDGSPHITAYVRI